MRRTIARALNELLVAICFVFAPEMGFASLEELGLIGLAVAVLVFAVLFFQVSDGTSVG